jgi:hypothetical protein
VLATLHGFRLEGFVTEKKVAPTKEIEEKDGNKIANPEYEDCRAADQQVVGFLLDYMSMEILVRVATTRSIAYAWKVKSNSLPKQEHTRSARA